MLLRRFLQHQLRVEQAFKKRPSFALGRQDTVDVDSREFMNRLQLAEGILIPLAAFMAKPVFDQPVRL